MYDNSDRDKETFAHTHGHDYVPEEKTRRCKKRPSIFIKRVLKSEIGVFGKVKKHTRSYFTGYHCCLFCGVMQSNITKHLRTHRSKPEVQRMLTLERKKQLSKDQKKELVYIKEGLRKKGDHFLW